MKRLKGMKFKLSTTNIILIVIIIVLLIVIVKDKVVENMTPMTTLSQGDVLMNTIYNELRKKYKNITRSKSLIENKTPRFFIERGPNNILLTVNPGLNSTAAGYTIEGSNSSDIINSIKDKINTIPSKVSNN